jgi:hypothetical protein
LYSEALDAFESIGDHSSAADLHLHLADNARAWNDVDAAIAHAQCALDSYAELGLAGAVAKAQLFLADIQVHWGDREDLPDPHDLLVSCLLSSRDTDNRACIAFALEDAAVLAARRGEMQRAALLSGAAEVRTEEIGRVRSERETRQLADFFGLAESALGADRLEELMAEGSELSTEQAIDLALDG